MIRLITSVQPFMAGMAPGIPVAGTGSGRMDSAFPMRRGVTLITGPMDMTAITAMIGTVIVIATRTRKDMSTGTRTMMAGTTGQAQRSAMTMWRTLTG